MPRAIRRVPYYAICRGVVQPGARQWDVYLERTLHAQTMNPRRKTITLRLDLTDEEAGAFYVGLRDNTNLQHDKSHAYSYYDCP